jgi:hypothetical protein
VTEHVSADAAPTPMGGPVMAGTYVLSTVTFYGAADAGDQQSDRQETLMVSSVVTGGFTLDQAQASGTRLDRSHGTVVSSGMTVTYTPTCPPPGDGGDNGGSADYTATTTTFTLFESKNGGTRVSVYTKS